MLKRDGRELARRNDERTLKAIHKFSWLRTRCVAALLFMPRLKATDNFKLVVIAVPATARRMAQRTLARLREQRKVIWIKAPDGSRIYGLSESGARQLVDLGIPAKSGKDSIRRVSLSYFHHRRLANEVAICALLQGFRASSEHEIAVGEWLGGQKGVHGKKPDSVVRTGQTVVFCEVDRSRRNFRDHEKLVTWLKTMWPPDRGADEPAELPGGHKLHKVLFLANAAFIERLIRDMREAGWTEKMIANRIQATKSLYVTEDKFLVY
ncbi:MAG: replication-relaxation family protein [Gammaproteobacteria bacterium]|nr:replication-relaxation family protein [Gammaproteobacteria bacterium]